MTKNFLMALTALNQLMAFLRVIFILPSIIRRLWISHDCYLIYTQINRAYNKLNKIHYF